MAIERLDMRIIIESARLAAKVQLKHLERLRLDVSKFAVRTVEPECVQIPIRRVVATDAGLISAMLSPFQLDFLHVADSENVVHVAEFFPLSTLAEDLERVFSTNETLRRFPELLGVNWQDLSNLWQRTDGNNPPMPRDVSLVSDTLRDISEWAVAMRLAEEAFEARPADSSIRRLILRDGLLRSFLMREEIVAEHLPHWWRETAWRQGRVAIAGVGKRSIIWQQMALALDRDVRVQGIQHGYIIIPEDIERAIFRRSFDAKRLGFGRLVLVKTRPDSVGFYLPVDLPDWIVEDRAAMDAVVAQIINVSRHSFPQPGYPGPLEKAHQAAHLNSFDANVIRDQLLNALRDEIKDTRNFERLLRFWAFHPEQWEKSAKSTKR